MVKIYSKKFKSLEFAELALCTHEEIFILVKFSLCWWFFFYHVSFIQVKSSFEMREFCIPVVIKISQHISNLVENRNTESLAFYKMMLDVMVLYNGYGSRHFFH